MWKTGNTPSFIMMTFLYEMKNIKVWFICHKKVSCMLTKILWMVVKQKQTVLFIEFWHLTSVKDTLDIFPDVALSGPVRISTKN